MLYKKYHSADYRYCILHRLYIIKNYVEGRLLPHDVCFNVPTPFHQRTRSLDFRLQCQLALVSTILILLLGNKFRQCWHDLCIHYSAITLARYCDKSQSPRCYQTNIWDTVCQTSQHNSHNLFHERIAYVQCVLSVLFGQGCK